MLPRESPMLAFVLRRKIYKAYACVQSVVLLGFLALPAQFLILLCVSFAGGKVFAFHDVRSKICVTSNAA